MIGCVDYDRDFANWHSAPQSPIWNRSACFLQNYLRAVVLIRQVTGSVWRWLCSISECRQVKFRASIVNSVEQHCLCNVLSQDSYDCRSVSLQSSGSFPLSVTCHVSQATFNCNIFWGELFWVVFIELRNRCHFHSVWICLCIIVTRWLLVWKD